jgi:hypothetical protein
LRKKIIFTERPVKVYVAGALSDGAVGYIQNVSRMLREARKIHRVGASPYVPCLDVLLGIQAGDWTYEDYFLMSQPWLEASDSVYAYSLSIGKKKGVQKEIVIAKKKGIPVYRTFEGWANWYINYLKENNLVTKEALCWLDTEIDIILNQKKE